MTPTAHLINLVKNITIAASRKKGWTDRPLLLLQYYASFFLHQSLCLGSTAEKWVEDWSSEWDRSININISSPTVQLWSFFFGFIKMPEITRKCQKSARLLRNGWRDSWMGLIYKYILTWILYASYFDCFFTFYSR